MLRKDRKPKLSQENEATLRFTATPSSKRPRRSPSRSPIRKTIGESKAAGVSGKEINPLEYWRRELRWPKEYFEPESNMLVRKKSSPSLCGKQSETGCTAPSSTTPSDESVNEGWHSAISFYGSRLQPYYWVGFGRSPFTNNQLERLTPFVGEVTDTFTSYSIGHLADIRPDPNVRSEVRRRSS